MLMTKPILSSIPAFDAEFGTSGKEHIPAPVLKFSWKDGIARKNRVVIRDYDTKEAVYDHTIETTALKHHLQSSTQVADFRLKNGHKYTAEVYVYTSENEMSLASDSVIFYCYTAPTFEFANFDTYLGESDTAVVNSNSINLSVRYSQTDGEVLDSYRFELQDYNGTTLLISDPKHSYLAEDILRYSIGGMKETETDKYGNIQINRAYTIICSGETLHGIVVYAKQKFIVKPVTSGVGALVKAENVGDGTVVIYSNFKIMNAQCSTENPTYLHDENNHPYAIDLSKGDYVEFIDGFNVQKPYELMFKGKFKVGKLVTLTNADRQTGTISLKKISYTETPFYYFSFETEYSSISHEIRTNYFTFPGNLIPAIIDFSYYNNFYNLNANLLNEEV